MNIQTVIERIAQLPLNEQTALFIYGVIALFLALVAGTAPRRNPTRTDGAAAGQTAALVFIAAIGLAVFVIYIQATRAG